MSEGERTFSKPRADPPTGVVWEGSICDDREPFHYCAGSALAVTLPNTLLGVWMVVCKAY